MKVLIIDDEVHARTKIRRYLGAFDAEVVGEAADAASAAQAIRALQPDLVFLDVQLRASTAFDVLDEIGPSAMPPTIFATAYDEHAVRAFEVNAVDYLLKPFTRERFEEAVRRALQRKGDGDLPPRVLAALEAIRAAAPPAAAGAQPLRWILVRQMDGSSVLVRTADIDWIEAAGNYVYLHCGSTRHLHRHPLGSLLEQLDTSTFVRVHRSAIVNLGSVQRLAPLIGGDYTIHLRNGAKVRLSRHYRDGFDMAIGHGVNRESEPEPGG